MAGPIHFWTADNAGCAYYRAEVPGEALRGRGYDVTVHQRLEPENMRHGTIVGQRVHVSGPAVLWTELAKRDDIRTVYEIDDDLWHVQPENVAYDWYSRADVRHNLRVCLQRADAVTVSTKPLAEIVGQINPNVHVVPNYIRPWLLDESGPAPDRYTVGWAGSATHGGDWADYVRMLNRWSQRNPSARIRLYGGNSWGIHDAEVLPWQDDVETFLATMSLDVMVIPLAPNAFNRSKSSIKALECMALGIVPICSDVGPYPDIVEHGKNGFLVRSPYEVAPLLTELRDPERRAELIANGRATASRYLIDDHVDEWERALGATL